MSLSTGDRLGHYEVLGAIGAGGRGAVYRARDSRLRRTVGLKVLAQGSDADAGRRHILLQEARAGAALGHPNIVVVYDVGSEAGAYFIAMECVDGDSLGEYLARELPPLAEKLAYAISVCDALGAAHAKGIIHRDLKPGNIMSLAIARSRS